MLRVVVWAVVVLLGLPAVVVTVARLSRSERRAAVQAQAATPLAIPLYAALAVLLGAVGVASDDRVLPAVGAVAAVALLVLHLFWVAPLVRADPAPAGDGLTVMTSNVLLGRADVGALLGVARACDVGLLAVQEMRPATLARLDAAAVAETFPHRAGDPRSTMVFARTPLTDVASIGRAGKFWAVTWQGRRVFAVHPSYPLRNAAWRGDLQALASRARAERPDVLLGDFNATLDHRPFRAILGLGYRDAAEQSGAGWQPTWPVRRAVRPLWMRLLPSVTIDHVLAGEGLVATSTRTVVVDGTDHKALVATLVDGRPGS